MSDNINGYVNQTRHISGLVETEKTAQARVRQEQKAAGKVDNPFYYGLSAYEVAVKNGYTGTEAEWVAANQPEAIIGMLYVKDGTIYLREEGD